MGRPPGKTKTFPRVVELLTAAVEEKGQKAIEAETKLSQSMISRYLKGEGEPSQATLEKLAAYFGVSVAWLRGEDRRTPTLVIELLKADVERDGIDKAFNNSGLNSITIKLLLEKDAEPNESTLQELSDYYCVSVARLKGDAPDKYSGILLNFKQEIERLALYVGSRKDITKDVKLSVFEAASDLESSLQVLMDKISDDW